jgi:rod shape-determining protein MreC
MSRAADRSPLRGDAALFASCLAIALAALLSPHAWTDALAGGIRQTALRPLVWVQQRAEEGRTSRARLLRAMAQRDSAAVLARDLTGLAAENRELRRLLELRATGGGTGFVAAEVLHQPLPTDGHTLLLSAGTEDGVHDFMPLVAGEGLLGVIARAEATSSIAYTWAHGEFRVSAVTENGAVLGIVAPSQHPDPSLVVLEFRGVAYRDSVPPGTLVLTSGLGGVYPRGIPIGRVQGVRREELGWERVYEVLPLVNPGTVSHVLVLATGAVPFPALATPAPAVADTSRPIAPDSAAAPPGAAPPR